LGRKLLRGIASEVKSSPRGLKVASEVLKELKNGLVRIGQMVLPGLEEAFYKTVDLQLSFQENKRINFLSGALINSS
jgi:hypothetical protein